MRDPCLTTLAEPVLELSEHYPGQFATRAAFVPPNAVELALNQAHDNFMRQVGYNHRLFRFIEFQHKRIDTIRYWLVGLATALAFTMLVVVLRY